MKPVFFLLITLFPFIALSQVGKEKETDPNKMEINKNTLRVIISLASDTKLALIGNYEREIIKPLSIVFKAGPAFSKEDHFTRTYRSEDFKWLINLMGSGELRYYSNLKRRIKLDKTTRNFSAFYFSLEQLLISSPLIIINNRGEEKAPGKSSLYVNMGYQSQFKKSYANIFFGAKFPGKAYDNSVDVFDLIHAGIAIGRVL
jgi:hypothetical protein